MRARDSSAKMSDIPAGQPPVGPPAAAPATAAAPVGGDGDDAEEKRIFELAINTAQSEPDVRVFRGLQTLNIRRLEHKLCDIATRTWLDGRVHPRDDERLTRVLHDYSETFCTYFLACPHPLV